MIITMNESWWWWWCSQFQLQHQQKRLQISPLPPEPLQCPESTFVQFWLASAYSLTPLMHPPNQQHHHPRHLDLHHEAGHLKVGHLDRVDQVSDGRVKCPKELVFSCSHLISINSSSDFLLIRTMSVNLWWQRWWWQWQCWPPQCRAWTWSRSPRWAPTQRSWRTPALLLQPGIAIIIVIAMIILIASVDVGAEEVNDG